MLAYAIVRRAQRLLHLAARDRLTGVYNRGQFDLALEFEVARAMQLGHELSVAVLDLDRFKHINDTFGHAAGDRVLVEVAARLARGMRTTDMIARYGGEEFAVLFPQTNRAAAAVRVETLRAQIAAFPMLTADGQELDDHVQRGYRGAADGWSRCRHVAGARRPTFARRETGGERSLVFGR